jgi:hypothetical protein
MTENLDKDITEETADDVQETDVTEPDVEATDDQDTPDEPVDNDEENVDNFPRSYVEKLRRENAHYRDKAKRSDDLAQRLHTSLVAATGRLQDPSDLTFDEAHLEDEAALEAAIDDLLTRKPHLASRRPHGDIGQGVTGGNDSEVNLAELLRSRA